MKTYRIAYIKDGSLLHGETQAVSEKQALSNFKYNLVCKYLKAQGKAATVDNIRLNYYTALNGVTIKTSSVQGSLFE